MFLKIHFIHVGNEEIYCIFKTFCIISVFIFRRMSFISYFIFFFYSNTLSWIIQQNLSTNLVVWRLKYSHCKIIPTGFISDYISLAYIIWCSWYKEFYEMHNIEFVIGNTWFCLHFCHFTVVSAVTGMLPHKTERGKTALQRLKAFEGCPPPYDRRKRMVVPNAMRIMCLKPGRKVSY